MTAEEKQELKNELRPFAKYAKDMGASREETEGLLTALLKKEVRRPMIDWLLSQLEQGSEPSIGDILLETVKVMNETSKAPIIEDGKTLEELCGKDPITKSLIADWRAMNISEEAIWQFLEDN
jgi:hypothetical protein